MWQDFLELLGSKWMNIMVQRSRQFGQVAPLHLFVVHAIAIPDDLGRAFSCIPAMLQMNILRWRSHPISWNRAMESVIESHSSDGGSHDPCRGSQ